MTKVLEKSGPVCEKARDVFEKIQMNSEEIGKMKLSPFEHKIIERVRAIYKENERLFLELVKYTREG